MNGVWFNGQEWVVAESAEDATRLVVEQSGCTEEEAVNDGWRRVPDDKRLTMELDTGKRGRTMSAAAWAQDNGRGLLGSVDW